MDTDKHLEPGEFYRSCVQELHKQALEMHLAEKGEMSIKEIFPYGSQAILWFMNNKELHDEMKEANDYYYVLFNTAIRCGMVIAEKWKDTPEQLNEAYVQKLMEDGPGATSDKIFRTAFKLKENDFAQICVNLYMTWLEQMKPYWNMEDPRQYVYLAAMAAFHLGSSMILAKY